ncbi:MAG: hypothetical protein IT199_07490 [Solirubrobacterales bacterium]|nr:hypothetical protein [Solirubrobacterales bacterium]
MTVQHSGELLKAAAANLRVLARFIVRLRNGRMSCLEGKGRKEERDDANATAAKLWVAAVRVWGKLGDCSHHICIKEAEVKAAIDARSTATGTA